MHPEYKQSFLQWTPQELGLEKKGETTDDDTDYKSGFENMVESEVAAEDLPLHQPEDDFGSFRSCQIEYYSNSADAQLPDVPEDEHPDPEIHQEEVEKYLLFLRFPKIF
mmetsp:Transcript_22726/g.19751  ORF Transcript_22726/g.19751 Transcript_22726/m.19751 type:complete len:109 (+) Transcript_22726:1274-1600(+)